MAVTGDGSWNGRRMTVALLVVALLSWLVLWWPVFLDGRVLFVRDIARYALPAKQAWLEALRHGRLALWTPYFGEGLPYLADLANQALYPPDLVLLASGSLARGVTLFVLSHSLLGVAGAWLLLRALGARRGPACALALIYGFSGVAVSITDNVNYVCGLAWVPLGLAALVRAQAGSWRWSGGAAAALAMLLLGGDVLDAGGLLGAALLFGVFQGWRARRTGVARAAGRALLPFAVVAVLGIGLAAAQLVPSVPFAFASVRITGLPLREAGAWSFPPARLLELVQPFLFGAKYPSRDILAPWLYPTAGTPWFESVYLGVVPLLLAGAGVLGAPRRAAPWVLLLAVSLLLAFGIHTPVFRDAYAAVPLLYTQRYPEKLMLWVTLALVVLAGLGVEPLAGCLRRWRAADGRRDLLLRTAASLALVWVLFVPLLQWPARAWMGRAAHDVSAYWSTRLPGHPGWLQGLLVHAVVVTLALLAVLWLARWRPRDALHLLLLAGVLDLLWVHAGHVPTVSASLLDTWRPRATLQAVGAGSGPLPVRVYFDPQPAAPPSLRPHDELARVARGARDGAAWSWVYSTLRDFTRLAPNTGSRWGVAYLNGGLTPLQPDAHERVEAAAAAGNVGLLRARGVSYVLTTVVPDGRWKGKGLRERYVDRASDLRVLAVSTPVPLLALRGGGSVRVTGYLPGDLRAEVRAPAASMLVLRESWYRGWHATVDGAIVPVQRTLDGYIELAVPSGRHRVALYYTQPGLTAGLALSALALAVLAWLALGGRRARLSRERGVA